MKIMIDPNCVFPADMTQEELDDMIEEMQEMLDNGTLEENSEPLSEEEYEELVAAGILSEKDLKPN